jgi:hypoxanthine phosphoribosyltransferase
MVDYSLKAYDTLMADLSEVLLTADEIDGRVRTMAAAISEDYAGKTPILVGVLKGVVPFIGDLLRYITVPVEIDFMAISSYAAGSDSGGPGVVRLIKDMELSITGRHVLFVEDVIDTGLTLSYLLRSLRVREPKTLEVCVLFNKPQRRLIDIPLRYKGFDLPNRQVVGWGLDYHEQYRNLPCVGLLKGEVYQEPLND